MRHKLRSVVVAGTSALLLAAGTGTASAQGSLEFALPLPIDIPGLSSLAADAGLTPTPDAAAATAHGDPAFAMPAEWAQMAFQGRVVAGLNEARAAEGSDRLVTDPAVADRAGKHADQLATGETTTEETDATSTAATEEAAPHDRTALELPADATPEDVLAAMAADAGMRERMLDGESARVGVGLAAAEDGVIHVVVDFED